MAAHDGDTPSPTPSPSGGKQGTPTRTPSPLQADANSVENPEGVRFAVETTSDGGGSPINNVVRVASNSPDHGEKVVELVQEKSDTSNNNSVVDMLTIRRDEKTTSTTTVACGSNVACTLADAGAQTDEIKLSINVKADNFLDGLAASKLIDLLIIRHVWIEMCCFENG